MPTLDIIQISLHSNSLQWLFLSLIYRWLFLKLCNFNKLDEDEVKIIIRAIRYIKLYSLRNEILKEYGNYVVIGNQSHDFTEFQKDGETPWFSLNKKGINKGYAINFLCDYLNINLKDTVGIGNDYNDKTMQKAVGTFICPNNARDFLKEDTKIIYDDLEEVNKVLKKIYEKR